MPSDKPSSKASEHRRTNKPIMEKKRRARINNCLNELKNLLLEAMRKDPARHSKLEKADILEMTVKYLQNLQRQQAALTAAADPGVVTKYRAGFNECAEEVTRFVGRHVDGMDGAVRQRLLGHLANCVNGFNAIPAAPGSATAGAASSTSDPMATSLPHLLRSRLGDTETDLAGLLASAVQQSNAAGSGSSWQQMFPAYRPRHHHHHHARQTSATVSRSDSDRDVDSSMSTARDIPLLPLRLPSDVVSSSVSSLSPATSGSDVSSDAVSGRQPRYRRRYQAYQPPRKQPEHVFAVPRQTGFVYAPSGPTTTTTTNSNNNNNNNNIETLTSSGQYLNSNGLYLAPDTPFLLADYMAGGRRDSSLSDVGSMMSSSGGSSSEDATGSISSCSGSSRYSSATSAIEMDFSDCEEEEELDDLEEGEEGVEGGVMMPVDLSKDADKMWRPW